LQQSATGAGEERHTRIDVLVNIAGITSDRLVAKMTEDEWRNVIEANLAGPFFMAQAAVGAMVEQGSGRIVNVSSIIGQTGNIGQANYAAAKAGLLGLTTSLASSGSSPAMRPPTSMARSGPSTVERTCRRGADDGAVRWADAR
jgi:acetoacetyl-CoA reductase/3-oxoacyl-[acyl-carrier protein] reductase